jgi:hypothetical protein
LLPFISNGFFLDSFHYWVIKKIWPHIGSYWHWNTQLLFTMFLETCIDLIFWNKVSLYSLDWPFFVFSYPPPQLWGWNLNSGLCTCKQVLYCFICSSPQTGLELEILLPQFKLYLTMQRVEVEIGLLSQSLRCTAIKQILSSSGQLTCPSLLKRMDLVSRFWFCPVLFCLSPTPPPVLRFELRAFILSHSTNPFLWWVFFEIGFCLTICLGWLWTVILISASWVTRITGVSN